MSEHLHQHHPNEPAIFSETHALIFTQNISSAKIQEAICKWIEEIQEWTKENRYLVGHIKSFVEGPENLWLSSTGRGINIRQSVGWSEWSTKSVKLNVTAIIFGVSKKILVDFAEASLKECMEKIQ